MNKDRLIELIKKRQQGKCADVENAELYTLMQQPDIEEDILLLWNKLHDDKTLDISAEESNALYQRILSQEAVRSAVKIHPKQLVLQRIRKVAAVAAVLLICWGAYLIVFQPDSEQRNASIKLNEAQEKVLPGSNKARIVFEDGTYQELGQGTDAKSTNRQFFTIGEGADGVAYHEQAGVAHSSKQIHTLITPIGGEYSIQLADGTKVWLNADSKLKYPVTFHGESSRVVELEGEAYFEVAKSQRNNKNVPFVVKSKGQTLEVLGTEFNVNTFRNKVTTTLIEGSVKVSMDSMSPDQFHILKPNDQLIYDDQLKKSKIKQIDTYYVTAWRTGDFAFDNVPLAEVMEDIARWYGVDIAYRSEVGDVRFSGKVSKFEDIETLLQTIEWTGSVKLQLNGRRVIVMK